jgi:hypothetical protein
LEIYIHILARVKDFLFREISTVSVSNKCSSKGEGLREYFVWDVTFYVEINTTTFGVFFPKAWINLKPGVDKLA